MKSRIQRRKACGRDEHLIWLGRALIATVVSLSLSASTVDAADFTVHTNINIFGLDIPSPTNPFDITTPGASPQHEVDLCRWRCDQDPHCMAFTWVRRGAQVDNAARCWFKASPRILENHGLGLMTVDTNTTTGVKIYRSSACWARHLSNLKFCTVTVAGQSGYPTTSVTLECPPGSRPASIRNQASPGRFDRFCVARLANDPGGLPNCTDAFGGESHEADVLGNGVNHACLDAN